MSKKARKPDKLVVFWSKREQDFLIRFPTKPDGHLAHYVFNCEHPRPNGEWTPSFVAELERRGYDTKTLRFSVERKESR